jgi:hypothetical protein
VTILFNKKNTGHIKKGTAGTSNEISFSVLGSLSSNENVVKRKNNRKHAKRVTAAIVTLICALLAMLLIVFFVNEVQHRRDYIGRLTDDVSEYKQLSAQLNDFKDLVNEIIVVEVNKVNKEEFVNEFNESNKSIKSVEKELNSLKADVEEIQRQLNGSKDLEAANNLITVINSELSLIDTGTTLLVNFEEELGLYKDSIEFIEIIIDADSYTRSAATLASSSSNDQVEKSKETSQQAIETFTKANELGLQYLKKLEVYYGKNSDQYAEISSVVNIYQEYISLRINAQEQAIKADEAYIVREGESIEEFNSNSNSLEDSAAALLSENVNTELSEVVKEVITQRYNDRKSIDSWKYESSKIADNLAAIDKYLT